MSDLHTEETSLHALARLGDAQAMQDLEALLQDPDEDVRARQLPIVVRLDRNQGRDPLPHLRTGLQDRRAEVREAALDAALFAPDERLLPDVAPLLGDPAEGVQHRARRFVKAAACQHGEHLAEILAHEVNERIRAMQTLQYPHRVPAIRDALIACLEDPHPALPICLPSYLRRLDEPVPRAVELSLLWALARLGEPTAHNLLRAAARSGDAQVMAPPIFGLGLLGDPEDLPLLQGLRQEAACS